MSFPHPSLLDSALGEHCGSRVIAGVARRQLRCAAPRERLAASVAGLLLLLALSGCGSGGGGSGSGNPTSPPPEEAGNGLLLEINEVVPALPSVTNPGSSAQFALFLDGRAAPADIEWLVDGSPMDG